MRIYSISPQLNAFIFSNLFRAPQRKPVTCGIRGAGHPRSPLEGIPVALKDNLLVRNCPAVWGSRLYANYIPDHDELPVARLREMGAFRSDRENKRVPEFAMRGSYTDNPVFGVTRKPWNVSLTPGGSRVQGRCSGEVAAGLVPLALATDGGGSIRRPAAHTGLVGLKPTAWPHFGAAAAFHN